MTAPKIHQSGTAPVFFLVAGEQSGDALGAGLIAALRLTWPDAQFEGVTGPLMRAEGCTSLADIDELSLFGISEVIGEIPRVLRLRKRLYRQLVASPPSVFIGIDAPAFNTGLERRLKAAGIPTVHYVCPTVWAWRQGRLRSIRRAVDLLLAIFPFEADFFRRHGVPTTFVGHRLADEMPLHPDRIGARRGLDLPAQAPIVALLPGSRRSEVSRLGPCFIDTALWLARRLPGTRFVAPMATPGVRELFEATLAPHAHALDMELVDGRAREVMRAADGLLLASGTATLEGLLAKTPMVVSYRLSQSNYWLARSLNLIKVEHVSMPNLLAGRALVPEFLQDDAQPEIMGAWLYRLLTSRSARGAQVDGFERIHKQLARDSDRNAAAAVTELLENRP